MYFIYLFLLLIIAIAISIKAKAPEEGFTIRQQIMRPLQEQLKDYQEAQVDTMRDYLLKQRRIKEIRELLEQAEKSQYYNARVKARIQSDRRTADELYFPARPDRFHRLTTIQPYNKSI